MKILALSGSNAENSMNSILVKYVAKQFGENNEVEF
ncbi:NAD(P)H-dependent oxidoreductase, partial [Soonwooa sp.]